MMEGGYEEGRDGGGGKRNENPARSGVSTDASENDEKRVGENGGGRRGKGGGSQGVGSRKEGE